MFAFRIDKQETCKEKFLLKNVHYWQHLLQKAQNIWHKRNRKKIIENENMAIKFLQKHVYFKNIAKLKTSRKTNK